MDHVSRLHREPHLPDALTHVEVNMIRSAIARWETDDAAVTIGTILARMNPNTEVTASRGSAP